MKHLLHKLIVWYLRRCGGAFHCYEYGPRGRYVVLMNEAYYHEYTKLRVPSNPPRCSCRDFPGADQFCTAHVFKREHMRVLEWPEVSKRRHDG